MRGLALGPLVALALATGAYTIPFHDAPAPSPAPPRPHPHWRGTWRGWAYWLGLLAPNHGHFAPSLMPELAMDYALQHICVN